MKHTEIKTDDKIVRNQQVTILELLDRLLDKGVMIKGEILLSVADVDLVYLNLGLLLSSVKTVEAAARRGNTGNAVLAPWPIALPISLSAEVLEQPSLVSYAEEIAEVPPLVIEEERELVLAPLTMEGGLSKSLKKEILGPALTIGIDIREEVIGSNLSSGIDTWEEAVSPTLGVDVNAKEEMVGSTVAASVDESQFLQPKTNIDPKNMEKGLTKLVLTLVDLIRRLMEKQAIRRIEAGQISDRDIERVANTFFLLDEKMEQMKEAFGLQNEELNLDLGPLGELI